MALRSESFFTSSNHDPRRCPQRLVQRGQGGLLMVTGCLTVAATLHLWS